MIKLQDAYLYLEGESLWVAVALFAILFLGFIYMGSRYLAAERKADRLQIKCRHVSADLRAAEMELQTERIKRFNFGKGEENG